MMADLTRTAREGAPMRESRLRVKREGGRFSGGRGHSGHRGG